MQGGKLDLLESYACDRKYDINKNYVPKTNLFNYRVASQVPSIVNVTVLQWIGESEVYWNLERQGDVSLWDLKNRSLEWGICHHIWVQFSNIFSHELLIACKGKSSNSQKTHLYILYLIDYTWCNLYFPACGCLYYAYSIGQYPSETLKIFNEIWAEMDRIKSSNKTK